MAFETDMALCGVTRRDLAVKKYVGLEKMIV